MASLGVLALTAVAGTATVAVKHLEDNVTKVDISDQIGVREPDYGDLSAGPVTILLMGSDRRTGKGNGGYGFFEGERSDTTMLLHIYPDRRSAIIVSIPRDTVVRIPRCRGVDGYTIPAGYDRFNAAYSRGGPGCTLKTLEAMSGLTIDHFVVLDFNGFKRSISALGGVEVCLREPIDDPRSDIHLPAGRSRISGATALDFVRVRHGAGDGSDISRINRQQLFLSSLLQEVTSSGLMTDPVRLWRVLDESSKSLKTDPALGKASAMLALAQSMGRIRTKDITFVTLPWLPAGDGVRVVTDERRAARIWAAIAAEQPWPLPPTKGADGKRLTVKPNRIVVDIHNAAGRPGLGSRVAGKLGAEGFITGSIDRRTNVRDTTLIRYAPDMLQAARTLQAALPGSQLRRDDDLSSRLDLVVGSNYDGVRALNVRPPKDKPTMFASEVVTANQDICTE